MSLFRRKYKPAEQTDSETEAIEKRYDGDLFEKAMEIASAPGNKYLTNIQSGNISKEEFLDLIHDELHAYSTDEKQVTDAMKQLTKWIWGYYIIEEFLNDDRISDIKIYNERNIRLKRYGKRIGTDVKFKNKADYIKFVDNICAKNKVSLTDINAILKFTDVTGNDKARLRFNITGPIINSSGYPIVHIRKILKNKKNLELLTTKEENYMIPEDMIPYLEMIAREYSGILFTGKGASGKSTVMNAMLDKIPFYNSVAVIQEADELFSNVHPDIMFEHIVTSQGEGKVNYDLKKIGTNGLLTDLDYYVIGEIKGDEAESFMNAAYTGHKCWTSSHGQSSTEGMNKLVDYIVRATRYDRHEVIKMLAAMKVVIFMKQYKIQEISEIRGIDENGEFIYDTIFDADHPEKAKYLQIMEKYNKEHKDKEA